MPDTEGQAASLEKDNSGTGADTGEGGAGSFLDSLSQQSGSGSTSASQDGAQAAKDTSSAGDKTTVSLPGFASALPKDSRADEKIAAYVGKFRSWDELTKAAMELESKLGGMVSVPKDGASQEEIAAYHKAIGVPEKPEDYKLEADKRVNADPAQVEAFRKLAHEIGLTQAQVEKLWKSSNDTVAKAFADTAAAAEEARAAAFQNMVKTLKEEWGADFARNDKIVKRGIDAFGTDAFMSSAKREGYFSNPEFVKLFYRLGLAVQEDTVGGGGPRTSQQPSGWGIPRPGL